MIIRLKCIKKNIELKICFVSFSKQTITFVIQVKKIEEKDFYNKINQLSQNKLKKSEINEGIFKPKNLEDSNVKNLSDIPESKTNVINDDNPIEEQVAFHVKQFSESTQNIKSNIGSVDFDEINPEIVKINKVNRIKSKKENEKNQLKIGEKRKYRKRRRKKRSCKAEKGFTPTKSFFRRLVFFLFGFLFTFLYSRKFNKFIVFHFS